MSSEFVPSLEERVFYELLSEQGLPRPEKELRFHPTRKWRFDYAYPERKLAIEIEGGIWNSTLGGKSRHFHGVGAVKDMEKYNYAAIYGWRVLKVQPAHLLKKWFIQMITQTYTGVIDEDNLSGGANNGRAKLEGGIRQSRTRPSLDRLHNPKPSRNRKAG